MIARPRLRGDVFISIPPHRGIPYVILPIECLWSAGIFCRARLNANILKTRIHLPNKSHIWLVKHEWKTNACLSSLAELSLGSAKWKLKFISAYFRRSFSFKNNARNLWKFAGAFTIWKWWTWQFYSGGSPCLTTHCTFFLLVFFFFPPLFPKLLHRPEKGFFFFLLCGNFLLLWLLTAQQNVLFRE